MAADHGSSSKTYRSCCISTVGERWRTLPTRLRRLATSGPIVLSMRERLDFLNVVVAYFWLLAPKVILAASFCRMTPARRLKLGHRGLGWAIDAVPPLKGGSGLGVPSPPAIWLREGGIVLPKIRDAERLQGLSPGWTKPAEHADTSSYRWKLVGNAVSVPAAKWLGRGLLQPSVAYTRGGKPFDDRGNWPPAAWNIGDGRFEAPVSAWPVRREMKPLHEFLREETVPLSERATEGFLGRLVASRLHVDPQFIRALRRHLRSFSNRKRPSKGIN